MGRETTVKESVEVFNMSNNDTRTYVGITPREAVIAAYAQEHSDWNTWDYSKKEFPIEDGAVYICCGHWCASKVKYGRQPNQ
jgi:hypothetical protein